jgi:hypothetical protein
VVVVVVVVVGDSAGEEYKREAEWNEGKVRVAGGKGV